MSPIKAPLDSTKTTVDTEWIDRADDSTKLEVEGASDVVTTVGKVQNVLYVPQLGQNLLSICSAA